MTTVQKSSLIIASVVIAFGAFIAGREMKNRPDPYAKVRASFGKDGNDAARFHELWRDSEKTAANWDDARANELIAFTRHENYEIRRSAYAALTSFRKTKHEAKAAAALAAAKTDPAPVCQKYYVMGAYKFKLADWKATAEAGLKDKDEDYRNLCQMILAKAAEEEKQKT